MFWEYIFGKNMTYTYKFKQYYHLTTTEDTVTTKKGYVCDSIDTFLLRNPVDYTIETKSFNWSNGTVDVTCYKEIYQLPTPVVTMNSQTYSQYTLKIENTGKADVTLYSQNFEQTYDIKAGRSITLDFKWSSSSASSPETVLYKMYFSAYHCTDSAVCEFKAIKETEEKKDFSYAPVITSNGNTYTYCEIMVTNKNSIDVTYYDRDVSDSGYIDIGAEKVSHIITIGVMICIQVSLILLVAILVQVVILIAIHHHLLLINRYTLRLKLLKNQLLH